MRVADALAHVLRLFQSDTVPHEKGSVDPVRDLEDVEIELILSDLVVVEKRMERAGERPQEDQERGSGSRVRAAGAMQSDAGTKRRAAHFGADAGGRKADSRISVSFAKADAVRFEYRRGRCRAAARNRRRISQGAAGRPHQHGGHRDLRQDRSGAGRAIARRSARISGQLRPERFGARPADFRHLFAARADVVSHCRRDRSPRLDHSDAQPGAESRRRHSQRFREEIHPRRSGELAGAHRSRRLSRACARKACCAWKAKSTSSRMGTCW